MFFSSALNTSLIVSPKFSRSVGLTATSYCLRYPPKLLTSMMPGMPDSCLFTIQSCMVLSSIGSYASLYSGSTCRVYWYISPRPVVIGIMEGMPSSAGISMAAILICSSTNCLASRMGTLSLNTMVTTDSPKREMDLISVTLGILAMAISKGLVIKRSTSWAASEGEVVTT